MILQNWITQFDDCLRQENASVEMLFYEHDSEQNGTLSFQDFFNLNEQIKLCMQRKDLQRVFDIMDKQRTKKLRIEDLKGVASLVGTKDSELD